MAHSRAEGRPCCYRLRLLCDLGADNTFYSAHHNHIMRSPLSLMEVLFRRCQDSIPRIGCIVLYPLLCPRLGYHHLWPSYALVSCAPSLFCLSRQRTSTKVHICMRTKSIRVLVPVQFHHANQSSRKETTTCQRHMKPSHQSSRWDWCSYIPRYMQTTTALSQPYQSQV